MAWPLEHRTLELYEKPQRLRMHFVQAGDPAAPSVLLLHGFPETWYAWRHQIPVLAERFHVIAPDLRGYGSTDKPFAGYDKRNMATDIHELMWALGIRKAHIVGHDRGARVLLRFAREFPDALDRAVFMDNIPTLHIFESMNAEIARAHWFFLFNNLPDLPEALIAGREEIWLRFIFSTWCYNPELFTSAEIGTYTDAYRQPGALRGAFSDYRAGHDDVEQDRQDRDNLVKAPSLILWGEEFAAGGKMWNFREIWPQFVERPQFVPVPKCGHLPHEECPSVVNQALLDFLQAK